jgi:hypothetical protein
VSKALSNVLHEHLDSRLVTVPAWHARPFSNMRDPSGLRQGRCVDLFTLPWGSLDQLERGLHLGIAKISVREGV